MTTTPQSPAPTSVESERELVLINDFAAEQSSVWAAWTEPDRFAQWWRGPGFVTDNLVMEVAPRGRFTARQSAEDGSMEVPFAGFYREVVPQEWLVFTLSESDDPDEPARTVLSVLLTTTESGTRQEFRQTGMADDEHFAALRAGTMLFFDNLTEYLQAGSRD